MKETIRQQLAALNAAWQRYARIDGQLDPMSAETVNREYLAAWEGLDACGIAEWMLIYDTATLTFSLPETSEGPEDDFATIPVSAVTNSASRSRWRTDDSEGERRQLI